MVTSGSFMLAPQSLGRSVSREVVWEVALDSGRHSDYSPSWNDPEVAMARSPTVDAADHCLCRCSLLLSPVADDCHCRCVDTETAQRYPDSPPASYQVEDR